MQVGDGRERRSEQRCDRRGHEQELLTQWLAGMEDLSHSDDPQQALRRYIRAKLQYSRTRPQGAKVFIYITEHHCFSGVAGLFGNFSAVRKGFMRSFFYMSVELIDKN